MTKKLLVALLLVSSVAYADEWLETANQNGGKIMLLTHKCGDQYPNLKLTVVSDKNGQTFFGCWAYFSGMVHVTYQDGTSFVYDPNIFEYRTDEKGKR